MQRADARFERKDPFPHIPFVIDEKNSLPALYEVIGWVFLVGIFSTLCFLYLGL